LAGFVGSTTDTSVVDIFEPKAEAADSPETELRLELLGEFGGSIAVETSVIETFGPRIFEPRTFEPRTFEPRTVEPKSTD